MSTGALSEPSPRETYDKVSLGVTWAAGVLTLLLLSYRLYWCRQRRSQFRSDDLWVGISILPMVLRLCFIHLSLVFLTTKFDRERWPQHLMSQDEIRRRTIGAQMVLPGRTCYAAFVWCMKFCILKWFKRVTMNSSKRYQTWIDITWWTLWVSFIGICASTYLECMPIQLYWQIWPDPGKCASATIQLLTMGSLNIATDLMLIAIPLPLLFRTRLPFTRKLQIGLLFSVSIFAIIITIIRMPIIISDKSLQKSRTLWASIECLTAALVANAPMFNSLLHKKSPKTPSGRSGTSPTLYHLSHAERRKRMPITGLGSDGSLTRHDPGEDFNTLAEMRDMERQEMRKLDMLNEGYEYDGDEMEWRLKKSPAAASEEALATGRGRDNPAAAGTLVAFGASWGSQRSGGSIPLPSPPPAVKLKNITFQR